MGSSIDTSSMELESFKKSLFKIAMKGQWEQVVKMYEQDDRAHSLKITRSGDTALHLAVSNSKEDVVQQLVEILMQSNMTEALAVQNERGNTALHLAASMGNEKMCTRIARVNPSLVGVVNHDGETPLFLTALHGKKETFLSLREICSKQDSSNSYYRRKNGETILHRAIAGEYFGEH